MLCIPDKQLWRVVTLAASMKSKQWQSNWLHEWECRTPGDFQLPDCIRAVLVNTPNDAEGLQENIARDRDHFSCIPRSIIQLTVMCQGLVY